MIPGGFFLDFCKPQAGVKPQSTNHLSYVVTRALFDHVGKKTIFSIVVLKQPLFQGRGETSKKYIKNGPYTRIGCF